MHFFIIFKISWVTVWEFEYNTSSSLVPVLVRKYKTKWWDGFKRLEQGSETAVKTWLNSKKKKNQITTVPSNASFLQEKFIASVALAAIQSKEEKAQC